MDGNTAYKQKFINIQKSEEEIDFSVSSDVSRKLFGNSLYVSATKFDTFHKCSLSYFLKNGLKIRKLQKADLNVLQRGTIVHYVLEKIVEKSKEATNFKLIQIMQAIRERALIIESNTPNMYIIRNGKVFIKDNVATENEMMSKFYRYMKIYDICEKQLIENLSAKKCAVRFPEKYELVCPTSEKNFIGDLGKYFVIFAYF